MANAERVQKLYNRAAGGYDAAMRRDVLEELRSRLLAEARGNVLELGVGTGATFAHYPPSLHSLTALDVSGAMLRGAQVKALHLPFPVRLMQRDFQTLPFPGASFDTAVSSLALCGIPGPERLFSELRRVLRPGGQLLALEHVRPPNALLASVADLLDPLFDHVVGCHPNRPTPELLRGAGFRVEEQERRLGGILVALRATPERDGSA